MWDSSPNPDAVDYIKVDVFNNTWEKVKKKSKNIDEKMYIMFLNPLQYVFESIMDPNILQEFNETYMKINSIWTEAGSAHDLYVTWRKVKHSPLPHCLSHQPGRMKCLQQALSHCLRVITQKN